MATKAPVSITWQTIMVFIPLGDVFAAYRIEKLRLWLLIFVVGFGVGGLVLEGIMFPETIFSEESLMSEHFIAEEFMEIGIVLIIANYAVAVFLIRKWSKSWNDNLSMGLK